MDVRVDSKVEETVIRAFAEDLQEVASRHGLAVERVTALMNNWNRISVSVALGPEEETDEN